MAKNADYFAKYQQNTRVFVDKKRVFVELVFWLVDEIGRLVDLPPQPPEGGFTASLKSPL